MSGLNFKNKNKPFVGTKGKKYGLTVLKKNTPVRVANVFGDDSDDEGDASVKAALEKESFLKKKEIEAQRIAEAALAEDPSVYDYDEVYDAVHKDKIQAKKKKEEERGTRRQPKYIHALLKKAKEREYENEIVMSRRTAKDVEAEKEELQEVDKYVTSKYKKAQAEREKWLAERDEKDKRDGDVRKDFGMTEFYMKLREGNVAFGTDKQAAEEEEKEREMLAEKLAKDKEEKEKEREISAEEKRRRQKEKEEQEWEERRRLQEEAEKEKAEKEKQKEIERSAREAEKERERKRKIEEAKKRAEERRMKRQKTS